MEVPITAIGPKTEVDHPTMFSLKLEMRFGKKSLAQGTGFVVLTNKGPVIITNKHNVTGINPVTGKHLSKNLAIPDNILVHHHMQNDGAFVWHGYEEKLRRDGKPAWIEHPMQDRKIDMVALRITTQASLSLFAYELHDPVEGLNVGPADRISVVGFPDMSNSEQAKSFFPIWATGFVASEPNLSFEDTFLIDCRSRPGQSGSPVIKYYSEGIHKVGSNVITLDRPISKLLGIYSGRISENSDLGIVWKTVLIQELVDFINQH